MSKQLIKLKKTFKIDEIISKSLLQCTINIHNYLQFTSEVFLNTLESDHLLITFNFTIETITKFLAKIDFVSEENLVYRHPAGFSITICPQFTKNTMLPALYYISDITQPDQQKTKMFDFNYGYKIEISERKNTHSVRTRINIDNDNLNITDISYMTYTATNKHFKNKSSFAYKLNCNAERIHENLFSSITIKDKVFKDLSLFDVTYVFADQPDNISFITLSDIIVSCGFPIEKMIGETYEHFMDVENIFNNDELKLIEMTYV
jgi:hypothetical protein